MEEGRAGNAKEDELSTLERFGNGVVWVLSFLDITEVLHGIRFLKCTHRDEFGPHYQTGVRTHK